MSRTALIIDNDTNTVQQVTSVLEGIGYTVSSAAEAEVGLTMASEIIPNIMLVNLATPGSNGLELCKTIHNTDGLIDVPIILLTLRDGKFDPVYVKLYGIVSFLKKPFDDDTLLGLTGEHSTAIEEEPVVEEEIAEEPPEMEVDENATMTFTPDSLEQEGVAIESEDADNSFGETMISGGDSDLGDLQASFEEPETADDGSISMDAGDFDAGGFDTGTDAGDDAEGFDAGGLDTEADAGGDAEGFDAGGFDTGADAEGFDAGGFDTGADAGDDAEGFDAGGFDTGADAEGFDAGGFDTGADAGGDAEGFDAGGFDAGADAVADGGDTEVFDAGGFDTGGAEEFDAEGTMTLDASPVAESAGAEDDAGGFDMGADDSESDGSDWGFGGDDDGDAGFGTDDDTGFGTDDDSGGVADAFGAMDDTSADTADSGLADAFSAPDEGADFGGGFDTEEPAATDAPDNGAEDSGFDSDGTMTFDASDNNLDAGGDFDTGGDLDAGSSDDFSGGFGESEDESSSDTETAAPIDTSDGEEGFDDSFLDTSGDDESADFSGDDHDYTGLFEVDTDDKKGKKKKKKKKKKGFKKGTTSKLTKALLGVLLVFALLGAAYVYRDALPFKIPFISTEDPTTAKKSQPKKRPGGKKPATTTAKKPKTAPEKATPAKESVKTAKKPAKEPTKTTEKTPTKPTKKTVATKAVTKKSTASTATGSLESKRYYVQFGVFAKKHNANRITTQLQKAGYTILQVVKPGKGGKKLTYVFLDRPYKTRFSTAKKAKAISKKTGYESAVYYNK